jgi:dihydroorotate dehydrogenase
MSVEFPLAMQLMELKSKSKKVKIFGNLMLIYFALKHIVKIQLIIGFLKIDMRWEVGIFKIKLSDKKIKLIYICVMYKIFRSFLFLFDTEKIHHFSMNVLRIFSRILFFKNAVRYFSVPSKAAPVHVFNLHFSNPIGLAAGFDKNACYLNELEMLGFGFVEIGTVTPLPQSGNEKPRLFRLPKDGALINRMGFNNDGADAIAARLAKWQHTNKRNEKKLIVGGNIGKNKVTSNEDAWKDYDICFRKLHSYVDYFVVNVSSPNTPGLRALQEKDSLRKILVNLQEINQQLNGASKPILLKISPDLNQLELDDVIDLAIEIELDGIVSANTTLNREHLNTSKVAIDKIGAGGLSGKPLNKRSTELVEYISRKTNNTIPVVASGGIFKGEDAKEKILAGACLVQVWTGFVYEGPFIVRKIMKLLQR